MSENAFLKTVLAVARLYRWRAIHIRPAWSKKGWKTPIQGPGSKGFPDLVLLKGKRLLFRELKTDRGKLSLEQIGWMGDLLAAGANVGLWTPAMWPTIEEELSR